MRILSSRPDDPATGSASVTAYEPTGRFAATGSLVGDAALEVEFRVDVQWE